MAATGQTSQADEAALQTPTLSVFPERVAGMRAEHGDAVLLVPVYRRVFADALTPVLAYRRLVEPDDRLAPSFLFESVYDGDRAGRYSFLGHRPIAEVLAYGQDVTVRRHAEHAPTTERGQTFTSDDPLGEAAALTAEYVALPGSEEPTLPSFTGGWVGYAGYDTVRYVEGDQLPAPPADDRGLPDLHFQLYTDVVVFDHAQKTVLVLSHAVIGPGDDVGARYAEAAERVAATAGRLATPSGHESQALPLGHVDVKRPPPGLPVSNMGEGGYQDAVRACKRYISAGDAFQIVPSQRFTVETTADPFDLYRTLRVINPSPYLFYLQVEGGMLVGSSPEILCRVEGGVEGGVGGVGGVVTSRPLAGTRKRGATPEEDAALAEDLQGDPKDRAEHVMLVDLHRNDVGRVAEAGTIELPELLVVERYSHVMHLSSEVRGRLRDGLTCWDALRYSLPVGTVSGAPKVRAMQIIDELEPHRRGPYGGAVGYADFHGNLDTCIALRTMVVLPADESHARWMVHLQAGAGIVADSDPDSEHQETVDKAAALAKAVELAESGLG
ncbi:MAG: anthranilate synthase component I [Planctomycetota bacterium]